MVRFSAPSFSGDETSGEIKVIVLLEGGASTTDLTVIVQPSELSPPSAEGKRCVLGRLVS